MLNERLRYGAAPRSPQARPPHSSLRIVSGDFDEFPLAQTTSPGKKDAPPPSSPHTGIDNVRTQYASPIPRSDAHSIVAANGHVTRLLCGGGGRLAAAADIWFELDTGRNPGCRMMSSRPAVADRDGPALLVRRVHSTAAAHGHRAICREPIRCSRAGSPSQAEHAKPRPNGACAASRR
jgi:hypothetical protein